MQTQTQNNQPNEDEMSQEYLTAQAEYFLNLCSELKEDPAKD